MRRILVLTLTAVISTIFTGCGAETAVSTLGVVAEVTDTSIGIQIGTEQVSGDDVTLPPQGGYNERDENTASFKPMSLDLTGSEVSLCITDGTSIMKNRGTEIAACDFSEIVSGSIVSVTYYEKNMEAVTIVIQKPDEKAEYIPSGGNFPDNQQPPVPVIGDDMPAALLNDESGAS